MLEDLGRADMIFSGGETAGAAKEQTAVRSLLQDHARAVTAVAEVVQQGHGTLHAKFDDAARAGRQMVEMVTAIQDVRRAADMKHMMEDVTNGANHVRGDACGPMAM
jgi:hypothetical protein